MPYESVNWLLVRSSDIVDVFAIYSVRIVDSSRFSRDVFLLKSGITCHSLDSRGPLPWLKDRGTRFSSLKRWLISGNKKHLKNIHGCV